MSSHGRRDTQTASPTDDPILSETAAYYGVPVDALLSDDDSDPLATARDVAIYLMRETTDLSFPMIARRFGHEDHRAVIEVFESVRTRLTERGNLYHQTHDLAHRIRTRMLGMSYTGLSDSLSNLGSRLGELTSRSEPHARALADDLSSLEEIKLELESLLTVVNRLLHARSLADEIARASAQLAQKRRS